MSANPLLGVFLCWLGGLASASFYVPFRKVRGWSWETYWLTYGVMSWIVAPWLLAALLIPHLLTILQAAPAPALIWTYCFGVLWGIGGLTFGLALRYLGVSLGVAVGLGNCAVFGTLVPPVFHRQIGQMLSQRSGIVTLAGVVVCALGIVLAGAAGVSKEKELTSDVKKAGVSEFNLRLGLSVGVFAGVMSACFAFGLDAATPIESTAVTLGTHVLWQGLPALVVILAGGFTTNLVWCLILNYRNRSFAEYLAPVGGASAAAAAKRPSLGANYFFSCLAGSIWYMQFFFYTMGASQMGRYKFSSWTLLMSTTIIFSTLWGIALKEWRGTSLRTRILVLLTLLTLVGATVIVGYGNLLAS